MYPAMLNIQASELKKLRRNPKPIILTLVSNWIVAPIVGFVLAQTFLPGNEQLIVAVILLSSSPCTAMVLVWGYLAEGNQEQNVINTTLNTATILVLFAPLVALFTGISNIPIDRMLTGHLGVCVHWCTIGARNNLKEDIGQLERRGLVPEEISTSSWKVSLFLHY